MLKDVAASLSEAERVLVVSHQDPDGDALGSSLGLRHLLAAQGKEVVVYSAGPIPEEYLFLPGMDEVVDELPPAAEIDAAVLLDCHEPKRAGEKAEGYLLNFSQAVVIDHHQGDPQYGQAKWVDPEYSATSEMLVELARHSGFDIHPAVATCFFVGVQTDTGSFRYGNTTARILGIAADLVDSGADPWAISQEVYATQPKRVILLAEILNKLTYLAKGHLGVAQISLAGLDALGCGPQDLEHVVEAIRAIPGIEVSVLLRELEKGGVKVSMRSRGAVDVAQVARALGGGGHKNAAGMRLSDDLAGARELLIRNLLGKVEALR